MSLILILKEMVDSTNSVNKSESQTLIAKTSSFTPLPSIFVLCDKCYWCATYLDKSKLPLDNNCLGCNSNNNELTSFPIPPNESLTFNYNDKRGVELQFKLRQSQ
jgi:hypothetical protein